MGPAYRTLLDIALAAALLTGGAGQTSGDSDVDEGYNGGANPVKKRMLSVPTPAPTARPGQGVVLQATCAECAGGCVMQGSPECLWRRDSDVKQIMLDEGKSFEQVCEQFSGAVCGSDGSGGGSSSGGGSGVGTASLACDSCDGCAINGQCKTLDDPDFQKLMESTGNSASKVCEGELGIWCSSEDPVVMPPSPGPASAIQQVRPDGCGDCRGCYFDASAYCQQPIDHAEDQDLEDACEEEGGTFCAGPPGYEKDQEGVGAQSAQQSDCERRAMSTCKDQSCYDRLCGTRGSSIDDDDNNDDGAPEGGCAGCKDGCFFEGTGHCIKDFDQDSEWAPWEECQMMHGSFCGEITETNLYSEGSESECRHCQGGCVLPDNNYCVMPEDPDVGIVLGREESEDDLLPVDGLTPQDCKQAGGTFCSGVASFGDD